MDSVDLVVTSPPYNLGISYGKYSDRQDRRIVFVLVRQWAETNPAGIKTGRLFFS